MKILNFLKSNISPNTTLLSIVDVFSRMCRIKIDCEDEMFLFETGVYSFTGKNRFYFSLVRQISNGDDEPTQIHCDILYNVTKDNKNLSESSWHENSGDLIQAALFSKAFEICKNDVIAGIDIRMEEA